MNTGAISGSSTWIISRSVANAFYLDCARPLGGPLLATDSRLGRAPVLVLTVAVVA